RQRARELVLGREHDIGRAHESIGPRREDSDARVGVTVDAKDDLGALRTADPSALRRERPLGPVDERQVLGEPIGVGGNLQHPLSERRAINGMAAALALAVDDFLVGEHGAERGAPVDRHRRLVREPAPEQLQEDPLRPPYIARIGGVDLPRPVVAEAEHLELALECRDVVRRRPRGMLPGLDRVLLGGQAERIPAHRVQHVVAAHAPGARHDIGRGVPLGMTDVQTHAGWVGEHIEDVALGPAAPTRVAERPVLVPVALPAGLDLEVVVGHVLLYPVAAVPPTVVTAASHLTRTLQQPTIPAKMCPRDMPTITRTAAEVAAMLQDGQEIAFLDVREVVPFGAGHPLLAINLPIGHIEGEIARLVPRLDTRVIVTNGGEGLSAVAARRLADLGYDSVAGLAGGAPAWAAAGLSLVPEIEVAPKGFGDFVARHARPKFITPRELERALASGEDWVLIDSRPRREYQAGNIPGSIDAPAGQMLRCFDDLVPRPTTKVVVNCMSRTRGILGAASLVAAGVPNEVYALRNGTRGWLLEGLTLERGAARFAAGPTPLARERARERARALAHRAGLQSIDRATLAR